MVEEATRIALKFFKDENEDYLVYTWLAKKEKDPRLRKLLSDMSAMELKHMNLWQKILASKVSSRKAIGPKAILYGAIRQVMGVAFVSKLLSRNEAEALDKYRKLIGGAALPRKSRECLSIIIRDEKYAERHLEEAIREHEGSLGNTGSIVLGLNDGLVEVLAAVVGLAVLATSGFTVVIGGIIIGLSGTLSMAGGAYLSSKSHGLVAEASGMDNQEKPSRSAFYTGAYYFLGALIPIVPFIFGLEGFEGIVTSIVLVSLTLSIASSVIAIISDTSVRERTLETLAISLGAAFATILLGIILRVKFGITI